MFVDFGSGYNPYKNFKTCDVSYNCSFHSIKDILDNSCKLIRCRNVMHHIKDLEEIFNEFNRVLIKGGKLIIIDCSKEHYKTNLLLDNIYYKSIAKNYDIWYSNKYRDLTKYVNNNFSITKNLEIRSKVWTTLRKN